jgi:hypothetical protein
LFTGKQENNDIIAVFFQPDKATFGGFFAGTK